MTAAVPADAVETIRLWADRPPPTTLEGIPDEVEYPVKLGVAVGGTFLRNISDPTLTVFAPAAGTSNGKAVVVVPGGGWTINAWTHEGLDVARWLTGLGYTAFLLKYRVQASEPDQEKFEAGMAAIDASVHSGTFPRELKPTAIGTLISTDEYLAARAACADDGRRAVEIVRAEAGRFGVDPDSIGMIGFSAGAFLIVDMALDPRADQVAWIAPIYGGETQGAAVPEDAPPLFTAAAADDILVRIVEDLHADWQSAGRPSELHVFGRGGHGFGMVEQKMPADRWTDLLLAWIDDLA
jgi:acetyl esterase/lipase